jgi:hypothetical protein
MISTTEEPEPILVMVPQMDENSQGFSGSLHESCGFKWDVSWIQDRLNKLETNNQIAAP